MTWRVAASLGQLRRQLNTRYPNRNKASDGTIGDADHRNRNSDHNPWYGPGIVTAMDITHDPDSGVDIDRLTDELQASRDPRIKYVIANRLIMSGNAGPSPWQWREYHGENEHTRHFHLSVVASPACDDTRPWNLPSLIGGGGAAAPAKQEDDLTPDESRKLNAIYQGLFYGSTVNGREFPGLLPIEAETQQRVTRALALVGRQNGLSVNELAEAIVPKLSTLLLPPIEQAFQRVMGQDNTDQARQVVAELARILADTQGDDQ